MILKLFRWLPALLLFGLSPAVLAQSPAAAAPSVAVFYGAAPPLAELAAFDWAVVEAEHLPTPPAGGETRWLAYLSLGEVAPSRPWFRQLPEAAFSGSNADWRSHIVDQSWPGWADFVVEQLAAPLWQAGYRGFFLDTLDSYQLATPPAEWARQQAGLLAVIGALKKRFPQATIIANRGFELLPQMAPLIDAVAAESLYQGWRADRQQYRVVPEADRAWLSGKLHEVQQRWGKLAIAIDYVAPGQRALARQTAARIGADGFIPWVSDAALTSLGVGSIELMPRRVLLLYDGGEVPLGDVRYSQAHRALAMPLEQLGYAPQYHDYRLPLPVLHPGTVAGIVVWSQSNSAAARLSDWLQVQISVGIPVASLDDFPFRNEPAVLAALGLSGVPLADGGWQIQSSRGPGYEIALRPQQPAVGLQLQAGERWLRLQPAQNGQNGNGGGNGYDAVDAIAITPWGGYALAPYVLSDVLDVQRWQFDPFAFLQAALRLPAMPTPDVTSENGQRLAFVHIDGDGFMSRAEMPGDRLAGEVLLDLLREHRYPTTMSVIEAEVAPRGLYPALSPRLEATARAIFALPHVELASHSYSHPFRWRKLAQGASSENYSLTLPGYQFDLEREIAGSAAYIDNRLAPAGKKTRLFLWTGDTNPPDEALALTRRVGLLNMNGGETVITRSRTSLTGVAPLGLPRGAEYQVFAPNQNENLYTNLWTGPFYGFDRMIETFELTESPRRLKPANLYYHSYAASKVASLKSLQRLYAWMDQQPLHPVAASDYAAKVLAWQQAQVLRVGDGWRVQADDILRQWRLPAAMPLPDLDQAQGIAGWSEAAGGGYYLHLSQGQARWRASAAGQTPRQPWLVAANARLLHWQTAADGSLNFALQGYQPLRFTLSHGPRCQLQQGGRAIAASQRQGAFHQYRLTSHAATTLQLLCRD